MNSIANFKPSVARHFVTIDGLKMAYQEANAGSTKHIIFIHGNSGSSRSWTKQLQSPLLQEFRLIALDLPAHGLSFNSVDPQLDYTLPALGKRVAALVNLLVKGDPYILVGFSLGANILAEALPHVAPPQGLVLIGSTAVGPGFTMDRVTQQGLDPAIFFADGATEESLVPLVSSLSETLDAADREIMLSDYNGVRPGFRPTLLKSFMEGKVSDEIALLKEVGVPILTVFGQEEKLAQPAHLDEAPFELWRNQVYKVQGAGHCVHVDQPIALNKLLEEYAKERLWP